jgi:hypothetical protein
MRVMGQLDEAVEGGVRAHRAWPRGGIAEESSPVLAGQLSHGDLGFDEHTGSTGRISQSVPLAAHCTCRL